MDFKVFSKFEATAPQKAVIEDIGDNFLHQKNNLLLGVTGSGKTFTMSKVIEKLQRPTLIITHNKTLVSQLYEEFREFFPENLVEYYVSHFDYFRPESYLPVTNTYISKETMINKELERLKVKTVSSLISGRNDIVVVASVSAIFGAGNPKFFNDKTFNLFIDQNISIKKVLKKLVDALYSRTDFKNIERGTFIVKGDNLFIRSGQTKEIYRVSFFGDDIEEICLLDDDLKIVKKLTNLTITPASIFVMPTDNLEVYDKIEEDLEKQIKYFEKRGLTLEAKRIEERTREDIEMMKEIGYCQGIENYSSYFEGRLPGERTSCLLDYFPEDFLIILDESHVTLPQLKAMYKGALSTKQNLVEYGFRLPSALNNRPLKYEEFESITDKMLYVSATPSDFELNKVDGLVSELLVRPTNILDPIIDIRPTKFCVDDLIEEINLCVEKNERVIVTTISKKQAENLASHLTKLNIKSKYLHGDIDTLDRIELLHQFRKGNIDVIVGINLLREGLDLPEVGLVAIMDADKEGFLRNYTSMQQVIGRAARNVNGRAILYADKKTKSILELLEKNKYHRSIQEKYNKENNLEPKKIIKTLERKSVTTKKEEENILNTDLTINYNEDLNVQLEEAKRKMKECSKELDFINAIIYRDLMLKLEKEIKTFQK